VPIQPDQCDDDDKCAPGAFCLFGQNVCAPGCGPNGGCPDPGLVCDMCASGSCCGCDDCVSACVR
jgi:hypothetical protein